MDIPPTDTRSWINILWAMFSAIGAMFMGLLLWNVRRQVAAVDANTADIQNLKNDRVTKGDVTAVYESIDALRNQSRDQYVDLSRRMGEQHTQILETLLDRSGK
jgi:hypothetical protein